MSLHSVLAGRAITVAFAVALSIGLVVGFVIGMAVATLALWVF